MSKKSIILAAVVVVILMVVVFTSRKMNNQVVNTNPSTSTNQEVTTSVSPLEQEVNQINTGNIDADFKDIDNDINNL